MTQMATNSDYVHFEDCGCEKCLPREGKMATKHDWTLKRGYKANYHCRRCLVEMVGDPRAQEDCPGESRRITSDPEPEGDYVGIARNGPTVTQMDTKDRCPRQVGAPLPAPSPAESTP